MTRALAILLTLLVCLTFTSCTGLPRLLLPRARAAALSQTEEGLTPVKQKNTLVTVSLKKKLSPRVRRIEGYGSYILPDGWQKSRCSKEEYIVYYSGIRDDAFELLQSSISVAVHEYPFASEEYYEFRDELISAWAEAYQDYPTVELYVIDRWTQKYERLVGIEAVDTESGLVVTNYYIMGEHKYVFFQARSIGTEGSIVDTMLTMINSFIWDEAADA